MEDQGITCRCSEIRIGKIKIVLSKTKFLQNDKTDIWCLRNKALYPDHCMSIDQRI